MLFFIGSLFLFLFSKFKIVQISDFHVKEYKNWFATLFITSANHIYYKQVSSIYACLSKDILIDKIVDNEFWLIKRVWSREKLLNIINSKIDEFNAVSNYSIRLTSAEYESILESGEVEEVVANTAKACQERLSEIELSTLMPNTSWFSGIFSCVYNNPVPVLIGTLMLAMFGFAVRAHFVQSHSLSAVSELRLATEILHDQVTNITGMPSGTPDISTQTLDTPSGTWRIAGEIGRIVTNLFTPNAERLERLAESLEKLNCFYW